MLDQSITIIGISLLILLIAVLYSSVGHGGASGYLAVLALFAFPPEEIRTTALLLNVVVAGIAFFTFARARHFVFRRAWPFVLTSVPAAFLGGMLHVTGHLYYLLLAFALAVAAARMLLPRLMQPDDELRPVHTPAALLAGAVLGVISGMIGIGGGIFLSPLLLLMRWSTIKTASATAAFFILVNSLAGLAGSAVHGSLHVTAYLPFLGAAVLGGLTGSIFGAHAFSSVTLRRCLALVLVLAAAKLVLGSL